MLSLMPRGSPVLDYFTWRDLAAAFVRCRAAVLGWRVHAVRVASTGSLYVDLRRPGGVAVVRLSDHRPGRSRERRDSMLSVRQRATCRLADLDAFLRARSSAIAAG
jgi:hypothetical protein